MGDEGTELRSQVFSCSISSARQAFLQPKALKGILHPCGRLKIPWMTLTLVLKNIHSATVLCWIRDITYQTVVWIWWQVSLFGRNGGVGNFSDLAQRVERETWARVQERNQGLEVGGRLLNVEGISSEEPGLPAPQLFPSLLYFVVLFR